MSWRNIQLGTELCDQDLLILSLFKKKLVRYIGNDNFFSQYLLLDDKSPNLILILNKPLWLSEIHSIIDESMSVPTEEIYLGINRYCVLGNDTYKNISLTSDCGNNLLDHISHYFKKFNIVEKNRGSLDDDSGGYFNFVQPVTWWHGIDEKICAH